MLSWSSNWNPYYRVLVPWSIYVVMERLAMSLPIQVAGYKANERPKSFSVDEDWHEIAAIEVRRLEPDAEHFRVSTIDWTLQSGFDGD